MRSLFILLFDIFAKSVNLKCVYLFLYFLNALMKLETGNPHRSGHAPVAPCTNRKLQTVSTWLKWSPFMFFLHSTLSMGPLPDRHVSQSQQVRGCFIWSYVNCALSLKAWLAIILMMKCWRRSFLFSNSLFLKLCVIPVSIGKRTVNKTHNVW